MLGLIFDPGGHLQAPITLTFGQSKRIKYFTPSCLFYKAFLSPQWFQLGSSTVFCDAFKRGNKLKDCWGETMSAWPLGLLLQKKKTQRIREKQSLTLSCLLCLFYFATLACVFDLFLFLSKNNIAHCCVLRGQRFIGQDTRADLWYVLWRSDPNDHLVNIWCCLTGMSGLHNST